MSDLLADCRPVGRRPGSLTVNLTEDRVQLTAGYWLAAVWDSTSAEGAEAVQLGLLRAQSGGQRFLPLALRRPDGSCQPAGGYWRSVELESVLEVQALSASNPAAGPGLSGSAREQRLEIQMRAFCLAGVQAISRVGYPIRPQIPDGWRLAGDPSGVPAWPFPEIRPERPPGGGFWCCGGELGRDYAVSWLSPWYLLPHTNFSPVQVPQVTEPVVTLFLHRPVAATFAATYTPTALLTFSYRDSWAAYCPAAVLLAAVRDLIRRPHTRYPATWSFAPRTAGSPAGVDYVVAYVSDTVPQPHGLRNEYLTMAPGAVYQLLQPIWLLAKAGVADQVSLDPAAAVTHLLVFSATSRLLARLSAGLPDDWRSWEAVLSRAVRLEGEQPLSDDWAVRQFSAGQLQVPDPAESAGPAPLTPPARRRVTTTK